jgi:hypothetical protein
MAGTLVASGSDSASNANPASRTFTIHADAVAGDVIEIGVGFRDNTSTVTGSGGSGTWVQPAALIRKLSTGGSAVQLDVLRYLVHADDTPGTTTLTIAGSTNFRDIAIGWEVWRGVDLTADDFDSAQTGFGSTATAPSIDTTADDETVKAFCVIPSGAAYSADNPTEIHNVSPGAGLRIVVQYEVQATAGSTGTETFSSGASTIHQTGRTAFLNAAAGGVDVDLVAATASLTGQALSPTAEAASVTLQSATATVAAQAVTPQAAATQIGLVAANLTSTAQPLTVTTAAASVALTPGTATLTAMPLSPTAGGVTVSLTAAVGTVTASPLVVQVAATSVALVEANTTITASPLSPQQANTVVTLAPADTTASAQPLSPSVAAAAVALTAAAGVVTAMPLVVQVVVTSVTIVGSTTVTGPTGATHTAGPSGTTHTASPTGTTRTVEYDLV